MPSKNNDDTSSLSHTKWNCKYHIVFAPKYRRKVFYYEKREAIGKILRQLCEWKGVRIIEAEVCPDHIHMLVSIPPKTVLYFTSFVFITSSTNCLTNASSVLSIIGHLLFCRVWKDVVYLCMRTWNNVYCYKFPYSFSC